MKTFHCDHCGALVFFENVKCLQCGHALGFLPDVMDLCALKPCEGDRWESSAPATRGHQYRPCVNGREFGVCNWFLSAEDAETYCVACRLNAVIPDVSVPGNLNRWHKIEIAKRRLIYSLRRLSISTDDSPGGRLQFRFLADTPSMAPVMTGHDGGTITLNIAEADDAERERRRVQLHEPQRTLVGHFRHESGHYAWDALIEKGPWLDRFRSVFGDERTAYAEALAAYYQAGPPADWSTRCVSAYASAHPWEDWAETWAHYLTIVDTLETAGDFGLSLKPHHPASQYISAEAEKALRPGVSFDTMLNQWLPVTYAVNSLNRGVGLPDLYPFYLSSQAREKLHFVHDVVTAPPVTTNVTPRPQPDGIGATITVPAGSTARRKPRKSPLSRYDSVGRRPVALQILAQAEA